MRGTVVVTASTGTFPGLIEALHALPVAVEECPLMAFAPPLDWAPVDRALERLSEFDAVAVTSPRAARAFAARVLEREKDDGFAAGRIALWAGGAATAEALGHALGAVRVPASKTSARLGAAAALAAAMLRDGVTGPVLFPAAISGGTSSRRAWRTTASSSRTWYAIAACWRARVRRERRRSGPR